MDNIRDFKAHKAQQGTQLNVDPSTLPDIICTCGSKHWVSAFILKKVSALISPNGQEGVVPVPDMVCCKCNMALSDQPVESIIKS